MTSLAYPISHLNRTSPGVKALPEGWWGQSNEFLGAWARMPSCERCFDKPEAHPSEPQQRHIYICLSLSLYIIYFLKGSQVHIWGILSMTRIVLINTYHTIAWGSFLYNYILKVYPKPHSAERSVGTQEGFQLIRHCGTTIFRLPEANPKFLTLN